MASIQNGSELCSAAISALAEKPYYLPYAESEVEAIFLGKHTNFSKFLIEVAYGYLARPVFQDVTLSAITGNSEIAEKLHQDFQGKHLLITNADSLEEKVFLFQGVVFVVEVPTLKFIMESCRWVELLEYCFQHKNRFLVMGGIVNDKYVHHSDIPKLELFTLVPQFLSDTNEPPELEVGIQLLKKKKKNESKK